MCPSPHPEAKHSGGTAGIPSVAEECVCNIKIHSLVWWKASVTKGWVSAVEKCGNKCVQMPRVNSGVVTFLAVQATGEPHNRHTEHSTQRLHQLNNTDSLWIRKSSEYLHKETNLNIWQMSSTITWPSLCLRDSHEFYKKFDAFCTTHGAKR